MKISCIILFTSILSVNVCWAGVSGKVQRGNVYYRSGKFDQAIEKYRDAQISAPDKPELNFNLAAGFYKKEKYEDAIKEWEKSIYSKDVKLQSKAYYNIGNSLYRLGNLPEAIQYYKKSLTLVSEDEDAKFNLEFVQRKLKEMMDQQLKSGTTQQMPSPTSSSSSGQQKDEKDKNKEGQKKEQDKPSQEKKKEMSKEDAARILDSLDEQNNQQRRKMQVPPIAPREEDW